ncbi:MAG: hypothetical protein ACLP2F_08670 [Steroidobacteraceae bacterium]
MQGLIETTKFGAPRKFWSQYGEASLNWLALGLLLAAWNAADNDAGQTPSRPETLSVPARPGTLRARAEPLRCRPESLRGYSYVSVRAVTRSAVLHR